MIQSFLVERSWNLVFVKEEFLHKNIQKKEDVFGDLTTKVTERKIV